MIRVHSLSALIRVHSRLQFFAISHNFAAAVIPGTFLLDADDWGFYAELGAGTDFSILDYSLIEAAVANGGTMDLSFAPRPGTIPMVRPTSHGLMVDARFQAGVAQLARHDLVFDAWLYQTQLPELIALARASPDTRIVLNHLGGPLAIGAYGGRRDELFASWRRDMTELAAHPNVVVKLGGLGMTTAGHGLHQGPRPPTSQAMASAYGPQIETAINLFGPQRCMFESNFPVDKISGGYAVLWNAFKRLTAGYSAAEKDAVF